MAHSTQQLIERLKQKLAATDVRHQAEAIGTILEVGDGIATVAGLPDTLTSELLHFATDTPGEVVAGLALNLLEDVIGVVILGEAQKLRAGGIVRGTGQVLSVPTGGALVGRVVNPLGEPVDGKGPLKGATTP